MDKFVIFLATGGYAGFFPLAPGSAGSLVGLFLAFLFSAYPPALYLLTVAALFFLGAWAAERAEIRLSRKDSPKIVIDEILGTLITMFLVPFRPATALAGFVFFRLFDILKPPPAGMIDRRMKGGFGVVLDDAVAGIYANLCVHLLLLVEPKIFEVLERRLFFFL